MYPSTHELTWQYNREDSNQRTSNYPLARVTLNPEYQQFLSKDNNEQTSVISRSKPLPTPSRKIPTENTQEQLVRNIPSIVSRRTISFKSTARTDKTMRLAVREGDKILHMYATIFSDHISLQDSRTNQQIGIINKGGLNLRQTYTSTMNGTEIGKCVKRFKMGSEKKIHYEMKGSQDIMKLGGNARKMQLTLNDGCVGEFSCVNDGHFVIEANSDLDYVHVLMICLIMIDVQISK